MRVLSSRSAFSLIEIALILVIVGMVAGTSAILGGAWIDKEEHQTAKVMLKMIHERIDNYRKANYRLPCPADPTLPESDAAYGLERLTNADGPECDANSVAPDAIDVSGAAVGERTLYGMVPFKTLGLSESAAYDSWGRRISYYVDEMVTVYGAFEEQGTLGKYIEMNDDTVGSIIIHDASGTERTDRAIYALVSHGENGHGAYKRDGTRFDGGTIGTEVHADEGENCDCNDAAATTALNRTLVQRFADEIFDDIVEYKTRQQLLNRVALIACMIEAGVTEWTVGAETCVADVDVAIAHGATETATDTDGSPAGSADYRCNNGVLTEVSGATCAPLSCTVTAGTAWTVGANSCYADADVAIAHDATGTANDTSGSPVGSANYSCSHGTATLESGASCGGLSCTIPAGTAWTVSFNTCYASSTIVIAHGASGTATDSSGSPTGTATYSCSHGAPSLIGKSCSVPCAGWGQPCPGGGGDPDCGHGGCGVDDPGCCGGRCEWIDFGYECR